MAIILANNATAKLAGAITTSSTLLTVQTGHGALFPAPSSPDWFPVTLIDASGNIEICKCTARSGDILTITRAQEGTSAKAFADGARVSLRVTKAVLDYIFSVVNPLSGLTPSANKIPYYTSESDSALATFTDFARTLLNDADAASARKTLGAQASDATLTALAGVSTAANKIPYFTGTDTASVTTLTDLGRTLLAANDGPSACSAIGAAKSSEAVFSSSGYIKIPRSNNGYLILQWGKSAPMLIDSTLFITFPTAFPSLCASVICSPTTPGNSASLVAYPDALNLIGFTIRGDKDNANDGVYWFAIGY